MLANSKTKSSGSGLRGRERGGVVGGAMNTCNFERLLQFVDKQLAPDEQLEIRGHLSRCDICRDAVCQLARDQQEHYGSFAPRQAKHRPAPSRIGRRISECVQMITRALASTAVSRSSHRQCSKAHNR
jgi:hypothetical protein